MGIRQVLRRKRTLCPILDIKTDFLVIMLTTNECAIEFHVEKHVQNVRTIFQLFFFISGHFSAIDAIVACMQSPRGQCLLLTHVPSLASTVGATRPGSIVNQRLPILWAMAGGQ